MQDIALLKELEKDDVQANPTYIVQWKMEFRLCEETETSPSRSLNLYQYSVH